MLGYCSLLMDESLTKDGAIEGADDGLKYAQLLKAAFTRYLGYELNVL
jgi:hypothetical protein